MGKRCPNKNFPNSFLVSSPSVAVDGPVPGRGFKIHCRKSTTTSGALTCVTHPSSHKVTKHHDINKIKIGRAHV